MSGTKKPTPAPLEPEDAAALASSNEGPQAESGKATAADAHAAAVAAARVPPPAPPPAAPAAPPAPPAVAAAPRARAVIAESGGQLVARPDPSQPIDTTVDLVLNNWFGHVSGKPHHVKFGTPIGDLPTAVQAAIRGTKGQRVGLLPPRQADNPFTP